MEHNNTVSLQLTQEDLAIVHRALCDYRSKLGNLMSQMAGLGLSTEEAPMLSNRLGDLTAQMCTLTDD